MNNELLIEKARLYKQYCLPYDDALVDDIIVRIGKIGIHADIGAGPGQVAALFAPVCDIVYAVEPDDAMLHIAKEVLCDYSNLKIVKAFAEKIPLPDDSVDFITIGNAYHRFRAEAVAELHRILKPSGWIASLSFKFTDNSFSKTLFPELAKLKTFSDNAKKNVYYLSIDRLFNGKQTLRLSYPHAIEAGFDAFWGGVRSGLEVPLPDDPEYAKLEEISRDVFAALALNGHIRIDYETVVHLGRPKHKDLNGKLKICNRS